MRTAIDLDLFGTPVRVLAEVPDCADALRHALRDHVVAEACPVGFVVKAPRDSSGFHLLLDRSGLVLARSRTWQDCLRVLTSHLGACVPAPPGTVRIHARAIVQSSSDGAEALLVGYPLLSVPPVVERDLARRGCRVLDRLAVDVGGSGSLELSREPWGAVRSAAPSGHCDAADASGLAIGGVVLPGAPSTTPTQVHRVGTLAPLVAASRAHAVEVAELLDANVRYVPLDGSNPLASILPA